MKKLLSLFFLLVILGNAQLATAQNQVLNGDFELGSTVWKPFSKSSGSEPSAFDNWLAWTIAGPGSISTRLTDEIVAQGSYSGHLKTLSHNDAIFQYVYRTSGPYTLSAWIYVVSGSPIIGIGYDNGTSSVYSNPIYPTGKWEYITVTGPNITTGQSGPAIKAINTGSEFYVDALWMNSGDTSTSPYDPSTGFVPSTNGEPGTTNNGIVVPDGFEAKVISIAKDGYYYRDLAVDPNNELVASLTTQISQCLNRIVKIIKDSTDPYDAESPYANPCIQGPDAIAFPNMDNFKMYFTDVPGYENRLYSVQMPEILIPTSAQRLTGGFIAPVDLAFSPNDYMESVYVAEFYEGIIYKVNIGDGTKTVFSSGFSYAYDSPPNNGYWLNLTFDSEGNLFASDAGRKSIYKISPDGVKDLFASGFSTPIGMAFSSCGDLYVADFEEGTISSISPEGTKTPFASGVGKPFSLAIDHDDNLFVLDIEGNINRKIIKISGPVCNTLPTNNTPTASAGENVLISSENQMVTVIHGAASDIDSDPLTYRWLEGENELSTWQDVGANGEAPLDLMTVPYFTLGQHTLTLEVSDSQATATDEMILTIDNSAPHAAPTGGGVYELFTPVTLGGDVSDFDGDQLSYEWLEGNELLFSGSQSTIQGGDPVQLPSNAISDLSLGDHAITLKIDDGINEPVTKTINVTIVDTTFPTLVPDPNKTILWPPNHGMVDITIEANANDNSGGNITLSATITSNEPQNGLGDDDASPDWTEPVINHETGNIYFQLRSERSGSGEGRVYNVSILAMDESGNSSQASIEIIVPHDKSKK